MNVTIVTAIVSVLAALSGLILGWLGKAREIKKETKQEAETATAIKMDVKYIKHGIDDVRIELRSQGQRVDSLAERVTRVEESTKQAHKRIDELRGGD